ncbi:Replicase polyprotein 1a [Labeo rohita]|uniref:Replicase polyprotein 1a n=1 Tax=Labeo rohita TaxID=84645 RepID=A0ABQ8LLC1_LABRO|nr:Replicase polyprotein 1a [Labeo rohita]
MGSRLQTVHLPEIEAGIELLIGTNVPKALEPLEVIRSVNDGPYAIRTMLGWTVNGPVFGDAFLQVMVSKAYAERVPAEDLTRSDGKIWYIPHHGVYHPTEKKIANRVTEILKVSQASQWSYIDTTSNPADVASRGSAVSAFLENKTFFVLKVSGLTISLTLNSLNQKRKQLNFALAVSGLNGQQDGSLERAMEIFKGQIKQPHLSTEELEMAELEIIRLSQEKMFPDELASLKRAIRAVHIEVASSLDTDSFRNALRRFIARRGQVQELRSDNGKYFVGAEHELKQEWNQ